MGKSKDLATGASAFYQDQTESDARYVNTAGDTMTGALTGTSAGFVGDVNIGNNDASNPVSKLRLGATLYGAADIVPVSTGHKIGLDFKTDSTGDTTIDPVTRMSISNEGYVTTPYQPHIFGSPVNSSGSGIANAFYTSSSYPPIGLSFSNSRITVPVAGVYLITYNAIAGNGTGREDINIVINGTAVAQSLTSTNESGYRQNNVINAINLDANDYIQFDHDDWYNPSGTSFDAWRTASVTLLG